MGYRAKSIAAALLVSAGLASGGAANAAVTVCTGNNCVASDENVLVNAAAGVATVTGSTQTSNTGVVFTSTTDPLLNGNANGQADISAADGLLNGLTFALTGGASFASATFNLFPLPGNQMNEATSVILSYFDPLAGTYGSQTIGTNGNNFLGISGTNGERFTSITFVADPVTGGIQDLRQLRLGGVGVAADPEPATWAMMLLGMGTMGFAMRRRQRAVTTAVACAA